MGYYLSNSKLILTAKCYFVTIPIFESKSFQQENFLWVWFNVSSARRFLTSLDPSHHNTVPVTVHPSGCKLSIIQRSKVFTAASFNMNLHTDTFGLVLTFS